MDTDTKIIFIDNKKNEIEINVHKLILILNSKFFEKLFLWSKNDTNIFTLNVDDSCVAKDIIMSFYPINYFPVIKSNVQDFKYVINIIKCKTYFCLDINLDLLKDLVIPQDEFNLLLEIGYYFDFNDDFIKLLIKNFPDNYDISLLSDDLINKIIELTTDYAIIMIYNNLLANFNISNGNIEFFQTDNDKYYDLECLSVSLNNYYCIASNAMSFKCYNTKSKEIKKTISCSKKITDISISPNNEWIITCDRDNYYNMHNGYNNNNIRLYNKHGNYVNTFFNHDISFATCVTFTADSKFIISGHYNGNIVLWNIETGNQIKNIFISNKPIKCIQVSLNHNWVISISKWMYSDYNLNLWNFETGVSTQIITGHTNEINSISFSHKDNLLASCSDDKSFKIFDVESNSLVKSFNDHDSSIKSVSFSPNDMFIASVDYKNIKLWDVKTKTLIRNFEIDAQKIVNVQFVTQYNSITYKFTQEQLKRIKSKNN